MSDRKRAVDPALLPHPRPCWCAPCTSAYMAEYNSRYRAIKTGHCPGCDRDFTVEVKAGGYAKKYCSDNCRELCSGRSTPVGYCRECGAAFHRKGKRTRCDEHFKGRNWYEPVRRVTTWCRWCLSEFQVTAGREARQLTCSTGCYSSLDNHARQYGAPDRCPLPVCVCCGDLSGKPFPNRRMDRGLDSKTRRCVKCELPENEATNGRKNAKRRRRESVKAGETFTVHDLIERDGDWCRIGWCGERVRFDVPTNDPRYGTIDHIVPISKGGEHAMANAQVACRECNCRRGDRELRDAEVEQLELA